MSYDSDSDAVMHDSDDGGYSDASFEDVVLAKKTTAKRGVAKRAPAKKPASKTQTKAKTSKSKKSATDFTLDDTIDDDDDDVDLLAASEMDVDTAPTVKAAKANGGKSKTVEEMYQKKTQLEHILLRPDTYIGSVEPCTSTMYVLQNEKIVEKEVRYTPGLFKIFDEIVVNAADNKQRDPNMDKLDIVVDPVKNWVSVRNNGKGIPIVMHKEHACYVPTLIFGHLLTGSNFDDDEKKTTGGRNGYGAKLANVFSLEFVVECINTENGLKFKQTFKNNMSIAEEPVVKKCSAAEAKKGDYVQISFRPDLDRFGMTNLDEDTVGLLSKRAYDIAGTMAQSNGKKLSVSLNGNKLPIKSFKDYLGLFEGVNAPVAYEKTDRWEVGVSASNDASMKQVSFVNAICTSKGGGHVNYIADQVAAFLVKVMKKKNKGGIDMKPTQVKNHLTIFVNCLVENPAFDSQTKEFLTTRPKSFGSECKLSDKFMKQIEKSDVVSTIAAYAQFKDRQALKRKGGTKKSKLTGITKLDDANYAGTAKSKDCTLIVTEGDSAKSLAMSGLSVVGRDYYGVFPLKGKPLNVRDASNKQVSENEEIRNLINILGLKFNTVYDEASVKNLRYGHLMIMADQDTDGSHIKGLLINFIHCFWPSLLDIPGFLQQFITPIVKVSKGSSHHTFFTLPQYEEWIESTGNGGKGWKIKYYKGLGTSTSVEGKEYFSNLDLHEIHFGPISSDKTSHIVEEELQAAMPDAVNSGSDLIDMVFRKDRVDDRKKWLNNIPKDVYLDYSARSAQGVKFSDFINREYILFSKYDNERSIPHLIDGFKPSQRKVLFGCFKRKMKGEVKVAQLTGYIAEHSSYHHGEQSLQGTIVAMAQNFVGSNNINLLTPAGQFGTRRMGGKDAASARYIFTKLENITRAIYHPDDDDLLNYLNDDGNQIEPEYYVPVIPMVLVNGAEGIGTGWSTTVNNHNPREIVANIRKMIAGEAPETIHPWFAGFNGEISSEGGSKPGSYTVQGRIERVDDTTIHISELPIRKWTQDYKLFLEKMMTGDEKKKVVEIKDFRENHTETTVSFTVIADKEKIDEFERDKNGLVGKFKLGGSLSTTNMTLFDEEGRIKRYQTTDEIFQTFYHIRLDYYVKRKALLVERLKLEKLKLSNKARFIEEVCSGSLVVSNQKRKLLLQELKSRGYDLFTKEVSSEKESEANSEEEESNASDENDEHGFEKELSKGYEYLLGMKIWSLTYEKAQEIRAQLLEKTQTLDILEATSPSQIWLNDLDAIEVALDERDEAMAEAASDEKVAQEKNKSRRKQIKGKAASTAAAAKKKKQQAKKKEVYEDSDSISDASDYVEEVLSKPAIAKTNRALKLKQTTLDAAAAAAARKDEMMLEKTMLTTKTESTSVLQPRGNNRGSKDSATAKQSSSDKEETTFVADSLASRLQSRLLVSPGREVTNTKKRPSPREEVVDLSLSDNDNNDTDHDTAPAVASKIKSAAAGKKSKPEKAKRGGALSKKTSAGKRSKIASSLLVDSESEESDSMDFHSDNESDASVVELMGKKGSQKSAPAPRQQRSKRNVKQITYTLDDSDDE